MQRATGKPPLPAKLKAKAKAPARGRPKDPELEAKVYLAAMQIYSDDGWLGFNLDKIARLAGVGKAAIYSRWSTRENLLGAALEARWSSQADIDEGSLEADLRALTGWMLERIAASNIATNMLADARRYPDFLQAAAPVTSRHIKVFRDLLLKSVARGELDKSENIDLIVQMISGALLTRFGGPFHLPRAPKKGEREKSVDELVGFLLRRLKTGTASA